jgi:type IV conjugative transfer system protein TraL
MSQFDPQSHVVPHQLEDPIPILFWDPLEFVLAISLMGFGTIMNLWVVGMVCGMGVLLGSRYLKRGAKRGAMQHLLWAMGLQLDQPIAKRFPPSWINEFAE